MSPVPGLIAWMSAHADVVFWLLVITAILFVMIVPWNKKPPRK